MVVCSYEEVTVIICGSADLMWHALPWPGVWVGIDLPLGKRAIWLCGPRARLSHAEGYPGAVAWSLWKMVSLFQFGRWVHNVQGYSHLSRHSFITVLLLFTKIYYNSFHEQKPFSPLAGLKQHDFVAKTIYQ